MRFRRLDLLAYGHFTNVELDLPVATPDFHIVFGLNEAGKSTALSAIEDLLFGIPHASSFNFLHDYNAMRLGAVVEKDGAVLEFRRRKGNKDTLLTKSDVPVPSAEAALAPFLGGVNRESFTRMFCLDNERLREGGQSMLKADDDVGRVLFSAGANIMGLREQLDQLNAEADALFGPRRSERRKYFKAEDKLKAADASLRDSVITSGKWNDLRLALEAAVDACKGIEESIQQKHIESRRLNRIRRVVRDVRKHGELAQEIEELGFVVLLPFGATGRMENALSDQFQAETKLANMKEQIEALRDERRALIYNETVLARSDDINILHEERINVRAGRADLPNRRAELETAEASLLRFAAEVEWAENDTTQVLARLPVSAKVANARTLANQRGALIAAGSSARSALEEAIERVDALTHQITDLGSIPEVTRLVAAVTSVRAKGDIGARINAAKRNIQTADDERQRLLLSLRPEVPNEDALAFLELPSKPALDSYYQRRRELDQKLRTCSERIQDTEFGLSGLRAAYVRAESEEHAVSADELKRLRHRRDAGWLLIRGKYLEGNPIPQQELLAFQQGATLPDAYEAALVAADAAADQRFDHAEAAARLALISRQIREQEEALARLREYETELAANNSSLAVEWTQMWSPARLEPDFAADMLQWLDTRSQILQTVARKTEAGRELLDLQKDEFEARNLLIAEMEAIGEGVRDPSEPVGMLVELAAGLQRQLETKAETRRTLDVALKDATVEVDLKRTLLNEAREDYKAWNRQWSEAIISVGLNPEATSEMLEAQLNAIDEMRLIASRVDNLRHERIEKIERGIAAFESQVAELVLSIAPELSDTQSEDAVLELERLLKEATRNRELAEATDLKISSMQQKIDECEQSLRDASRLIDALKIEAKVETVDDLRVAISRSDRSRTLQSDIASIQDRLAEDGDGKPVSELIEECAGADLDEATAREEALGHELGELRERYAVARDTQANARRDFEAIGGDDKAAKAAAERQAALAEMKDIAESYVRIRSSARLLQWAIDRYRREMQEPLLRRAGEFFEILTRGSFKSSRVEFDQDDLMHLAGLRPDGKLVRLSGMSTGARDQLYLALRIAAIEDFFRRSGPMPFIADDLFVQFDDYRAETAFKVLGQLAQKTQVLFFTHHHRLLEIAKNAFGNRIPVAVLTPNAVQVVRAREDRTSKSLVG